MASIPYQICADDSVVNDLLQFVQATANPEYIKNHYYKLMINVWEQIKESSDGVKLKLYLYALRPALVLQWLHQFDGIPPMDMQSLLKQSINTADLTREIFALISLKARANEGDIVPRNLIIDAFIESIVLKVPHDVKNSIDNEKLIVADKLFRKIIE